MPRPPRQPTSVATFRTKADLAAWLVTNASEVTVLGVEPRHRVGAGVGLSVRYRGKASAGQPLACRKRDVARSRRGLDPAHAARRRVTDRRVRGT